jgi:methyltransferase (TIGR00027 family)
MTARKVAGDFLFVVEDPEVAKLAPPGSIEATYEILEASGWLKPWMISLIKAPWYQHFGRALERQILPGQMLHLVLRKRFLDDEVRAAIAAGAAQVLVVGGGFDTLSLRLAAEYPEVRFLELDHPPTHASKAEAVKEIGAESPNLHLEGVDLSQRSLSEYLHESRFWSAEVKSVAIAEGVLMYLTEAEVVAFLEAVRSSSSWPVRLLVSYIYEQGLGRESLGWLGGVLKGMLKVVGEPFRWGVGADGIEPFFAARGFRVVGEVDQFDLERRYVEPAGHGDWAVSRFERVVAAESVVD